MKRYLIILFCLISYCVNAQWFSEPKNVGCLYNDSIVGQLDKKGWVFNKFGSYKQIEEQGNLIHQLSGIEMPYVSGLGVDQIFDLGGLGDKRFNKNAYIGNSFGLPEYYDFPYDTLYYDASNPYHWKIKDFHYLNFESQMDSLTNIAFAKLNYGDLGHRVTWGDDGIIYKENKVAYGIWEFGLLKINGSTAINNFINDNTTLQNNGYSVRLSSGGNLRLQISTGGSNTNILGTATTYISDSIQYKIRVERNSEINEYHTGGVGSFRVLIKGGQYGVDYILVNVTGGTGTNPILDNTYTTSSYTVIDNDFLNFVENFFVGDEELNFNSFTQSTGIYAIDNLAPPNEFLLFENEQTELSDIFTYCNILPISLGWKRAQDANAVSDPFGNEANSTNGWIDNDILIGAGNVFESQSSVVSIGTYAIEANLNGTAEGSGGCVINLDESPYNLINGRTYQATFDIRHVGVGERWGTRTASNTTLSTNDIDYWDIESTDIVYETISILIEKDANAMYFGFRERNVSNDGGVYFDNFSLREYSPIRYKNEF